VSAAEATAVSANEESAAPAETATEGGARATEGEARAGADGGEARVERRGDETRKGAARETEGAEAEAQTRERVSERGRKYETTPFSVHGAAMLKMQRGEEMLRYADQHVAAFDEFAFQVLFSQLHKRIRGSLDDDNRQLVVRICERMEDRISSFKEGRTLSSIMYGLCKLGVEPTRSFLKLWSEQCIAVMSTFNPQDLSNALYSLGVFDYRPNHLCTNFFLKMVGGVCCIRFRSLSLRS
jgi:hypothetical protein